MTVAVRISQGGRLVLPASIRKALGLVEGSTVLLQLKGSKVELKPMSEAVLEVQKLLAPYRPKDSRLLSEELVVERKREAARE